MHGLGPLIRVTISSTCSWLDHLVSGLIHRTYRFLKLALTEPSPNGLSLLYELTCWPIIQKVRCYKWFLLQLLVSIQFQILLTPFILVLFTFPSRYLFTLLVIGYYLGLEGGPPMFRQDFTYPVLLFLRIIIFISNADTGLAPSMARFS